MQAFRFSFILVGATICAAAFGQGGSPLVKKAWALDVANAKSFGDGKVMAHSGDDLAMSFKLMPPFSKRYPEVTSVAIFWTKGKKLGVTVFFTRGTGVGAALKQLGFPSAKVGPVAYPTMPPRMAHADPRRIRALFPGEQLVSGAKVPPGVTVKFISVPGREPCLDFRTS